MTFRVDQTQAVQTQSSGEESVPAPRVLSKPVLVANPNPAWARLSSAAAPAAGGALSAPSRVGAGLRSPSPRAQLAAADAKLQALQELAATTLASIDPEHREAIAAVFGHDIAQQTAYRDSLVG